MAENVRGRSYLRVSQGCVGRERPVVISPRFPPFPHDIYEQENVIHMPRGKNFSRSFAFCLVALYLLDNLIMEGEDPVI